MEPMDSMDCIGCMDFMHTLDYLQPTGIQESHRTARQIQSRSGMVHTEPDSRLVVGVRLHRVAANA